MRRRWVVWVAFELAVKLIDGDTDLIKIAVFAKLDAVCKPECILASNTSYLDVDEIAAATARPEQVIGAHFFSPANVMRLLEIVRGERTSKTLIATSMAMARRCCARGYSFRM